MTGTASILGTLRSVDGEGVVRIEDLVDAPVDEVWAALTEPDRLARWFGTVEGDLSAGSDFRVNITLSGPRTGHVDACEPARHLAWTLRDPDRRPGQPERMALDVRLTADGAETSVVWEERGMPVELLPAYGTGIQIHVEHLVDYLGGRELRDGEARWDELFPVYEAQEIR